jgi:alcohol-forming fatty acyl-CoA reductase
VVTGAGLGVLRIFYINNKNHADVVPADIVVNLTLAVAWKTARENHNVVNVEDLSAVVSAKSKIKIYNCTNFEDNPLNWGEVKRQTIKAGKMFPLEKSLWIVTYNTTKVKVVYEFLKIFYHILPAILFDLFLRLRREKPK